MSIEYSPKKARRGPNDFASVVMHTLRVLHPGRRINTRVCYYFFIMRNVPLGEGDKTCFEYSTQIVYEGQTSSATKQITGLILLLLSRANMVYFLPSGK